MHKNKRNMLALAAALALLSACTVPSVNPLYTDNDLVFDPHLSGVWADEHATEPADEKWVFEKDTDNSYKLTITEGPDKKGQFETHLIKLKDYFFLDLKPSDFKLDTTQVDETAWSLIPGHLILRVDELDPELKLTLLRRDWLNEYLRKNPKGLAHVKEGADVKFITASTHDLQQFVLSHLGKNELFGEPDALVRRPAGAR